MEKEKYDENKEEKRTGSDEDDKVIKLLFSFVSPLIQLIKPTCGTDIPLVTRNCRGNFTLLRSYIVRGRFWFSCNYHEEVLVPLNLPERGSGCLETNIKRFWFS
jgi:hypothetical protein